MKSRTKISWADFTLNPWEGCTKVSAGCKNCYAETRNQRYAAGKNWGPGAPRRLSVSALSELEIINRRFAPAGGLTMMEVTATAERWIYEKEIPETSGPSRAVKPQVFSLSLGDVLDPEVPAEWLARWIAAIGEATNLEFLLLTKRPELFASRMKEAYDCLMQAATVEEDAAFQRVATGQNNHVAWGTSVEDRKTSSRIALLAEIPAPARFISCEPLLADPVLWEVFNFTQPSRINLVISGGESGVQARPMHPTWIERIQRDCYAVEIPHHFKQWGTWAPEGLVKLDGNQANPGNICTIPATSTTEAVTMHRTPSKLSVPPLIGGKIQQPRLVFPA